MSRLSSPWTSLTAAAPPTVAVEIAAERVSAVSLEMRAGRPAVAAHASEPLPAGALIPLLTAQNIRDKAAVTSALTRVLDGIGRPRRIGLVIPDLAAKVSLVRFEQVPARAQDLDRLIRWQVRKAAPFPIDDAQVSHVAGLRTDGGQEFIVSLARREVIVEYEGICSAAGAHAGIVDLSTFNVINAVLAGSNAPTADWLLVNVAPDSASIAILRGPHVILFRSRGAEADGTLAELVHQTAMYYEDRLQGTGFGRVLLSGASTAAANKASDVDQTRRSLQDRLGTAVEAVDPRTAVDITDRISASPAFLDTLAPLVGLLLREKVAA